LKKRPLFFLALSAALVSLPALGRGEAETASPGGPPEPFFESSYKRYLDKHGYRPGIRLAAGEITLDTANFTISGGMDAYPAAGGGTHTGDSGLITWPFFVPQAGFYHLEVSYLPEKGANSSIKRVIMLDGEILHDGLRQAAFNRTYRDGQGRIEVKNRNEIRPKAEEIFTETRVFVGDSQKRSLEPYLFYLSPGGHTLAFESIKEPVIIRGLRFAAAAEPPSYADYAAASAAFARPYAGERLVFQAERAGENTDGPRKSSPSITVKNNAFDPALEPFHPYRIVYNTIGGDTWKYPGEVIEWEIAVPEEGLYRIALKGRQSVNRGITSYRSLKINGQTPFAEAQYLDFAYSPVMKNYVPGGDEPYLFYFKQGRNTLSLETVLGGFGGPYAEVSESVMILNGLYRRIIQITGTVPDMFIDYEVSRKVPGYTELLESEGARLARAVEALNRITVEKGANTNMIERFVEQIKRLSRRPDNITQELGQFKSNISVLAAWLTTVSEMPLELDSFSLLAADGLPGPARAGIARRLLNNTVRFFSTFFVNASAVDAAGPVKSGRGTLKVWIPSGRDQAQVLRGLIDERFIPEQGIAVNLELVSIDVVMPSTLAGVGPDVALNLDQTRLMDFALRNALVDLSSLPGFERERAKFYPSALEGISFQGKTCGLPETQSFLILFYRRDILESLGLRPPKTWDELREMIPVFHMNNYDVYMPHPGPFASMIVQKGGDYYLGTGSDYGIASGMLEEPAMLAFKELTDFFTAYKLPVAMDFSNRFRTGEVPLGIADYTEYCRLELFAPEIRGLWSFAPLPGTLRKNGTIDNRVVTGTTQTVILKAAEKRGLLDEAWAFTRWWLETGVQAEYANGIEAILGSSARYAAANPDVLVQLPWSAGDAAKLLEQFAATKGIPPVPGNYMTSRMVDYAFNNVVAGRANARESLYLNTRDINEELSKKRREFGFSYINYGGR
jgi:ABC-type glycerol-3-phosphate transport system substrate-binding protein